MVNMTKVATPLTNLENFSTDELDRMIDAADGARNHIFANLLDEEVTHRDRQARLWKSIKDFPAR